MSEQFRSILGVSIIIALIAVFVSLTAPNNDPDSKTYHGVWIDAFEEAAFFEGKTRDDFPSLLRGSPDGWLSFDPDQWPLEPSSSSTDNLGYFEVSFVGRKVVGEAGHLRQYPTEYFAEQIISIERICYNFIATQDEELDCIRP